MCDVFCKELRGWCRAFTRAERLLTVLEALLLIVLIGFLVFLALHFSVCPQNDYGDVSTPKSQTNVTPDLYDEDTTGFDESTTYDHGNSTGSEKVTKDEDGSTEVDDNVTEDDHDDDSQTETPLTPRPQISPTTPSNASTDKSITTPAYNGTGRPNTKASIKCTWKPSEQTRAGSRYYDVDGTTAQTQQTSQISTETETTGGQIFTDFPKFGEESDGEEAQEELQGIVLALVKVTAGETTFGCALTVVARRWALTAASCVEAIEEVDSLDNFVMQERYGSPWAARAHPVADLRVHPRYRAGRARHDVAGLRAQAALLQPPFLELARPLDDLLLTVGETITILGFGRFRTVDTGPEGRKLRATQLVRLPPSACAPPPDDEGAEGGELVEGSWALRHLWGGAPAGEGAPAGSGRGAVCAGVRWARGAPCHYCGGSPLLVAGRVAGRGAGRGRGRLLGVMARSELCGAACEPTYFVNMADVADWVQAVIQT